MTTYQRESFEAVFPEALPLLEAHWQELGSAPEEALNVNLPLYQQADANESLRVFTARLDGKLVGYSAIFVHNGIHCAHQKQATQDVFYVMPEYRGGMIGTRLIKTAEECLWCEEVQVTYQHTNVKNMLLGRLLEALGYEPDSIVYKKRLT